MEYRTRAAELYVQLWKLHLGWYAVLTTLSVNVPIEMVFDYRSFAAYERRSVPEGGIRCRALVTLSRSGSRHACSLRYEGRARLRQGHAATIHNELRFLSATKVLRVQLRSMKELSTVFVALTALNLELPCCCPGPTSCNLSVWASQCASDLGARGAWASDHHLNVHCGHLPFATLTSTTHTQTADAARPSLIVDALGSFLLIHINLS